MSTRCGSRISLRHPEPGVVAPELFDVEPFRGLTSRHAVVRQIDRPILVLGSTQRRELVFSPAAKAQGVEVVRRRGGGGAVLLEPDNQVWIDAWIPRNDPLWQADVGAAAAWVGQWWFHALGVSDRTDWSIHVERARPGPFGELVCFAGRGPGEVFWEKRKVVGLSQWRSREGSLFLCCGYSAWRPQPLVDLLDLPGEERSSLVRHLTPLVAGLTEIHPALPNATTVGTALLSSFPTWE
jgi:lipoate-protein ligase A